MSTPQSPSPTPSSAEEELTEKDWELAPAVVRKWAYPLTVVGVIVLPLIISAALMGMVQFRTPVERFGIAFSYSILWAAIVWLKRGLRSANPHAWTIQAAISLMGLVLFPIGTFLYGYILSQWFKPEVKNWFNR